MWRRIFSSKMVVKKGARCRIGTSSNNPLFGAPWLKDGLFFVPDNPIYASLAHAKVNDIMSLMTGDQLKLFEGVVLVRWP